LIVGVVLTLSLFLVDRVVYDFQSVTQPEFSRSVFGLALLLALLSIFGLLVTSPDPEPVTEQLPLGILTYNIQQGYSADGLKNFDGQLALIRELNPDIIGLQESDTARVSGGNDDVVRFLADNLDMFAYYGPKTVPGTFGIALLSRFPIESPKTYYLYSEGEQVAVIEAQITVGDRTFNVYVNHLGNDGPMVQQDEFLQLVEGVDHVIAMGDYNFRPDSEQYALTTELLDESWLLKWPDGVDDQGISSERRIDYIFVSPGTEITDARHIFSPASDHPAVTAEID
jgi:endonuclease/exonuclease/phosphatase family metal-dependent hydrolase